MYNQFPPYGAFKGGRLESREEQGWKRYKKKMKEEIDLAGILPFPTPNELQETAEKAEEKFHSRLFPHFWISHIHSPPLEEQICVKGAIYFSSSLLFIFFFQFLLFYVHWPALSFSPSLTVPFTTLPPCPLLPLSTFSYLSLSSSLSPSFPVDI